MFVVAVRTGPVPESDIMSADRVISSLEEFPWQVLGPSQHPSFSPPRTSEKPPSPGGRGLG